MSVLRGDCVEVMAGMEPDSVDAIVCDPPYGLEFMGKDWDRLDAGLPQESVWKGRRGKGGSDAGSTSDRAGAGGRTIPANRASFGGDRAGFRRCTLCGKRAFSGSPCRCPEPVWVVEYPEGPPSGMVRMERWHERWAREAYRILKPGGHLLAFGGSRTYHRLAAAIEDAGFEIRDQLMWVYASGFPKSLDVSKAIDKAAGAERHRYIRASFGGTFSDDNGSTYGTALVNEATTDAAREWSGWGTALKPAHEPIVMARKPLIGTVAQNVQEHGTGALNIDGCRIGTSDRTTVWHSSSSSYMTGKIGEVQPKQQPYMTGSDSGRWPANVILTDPVFDGGWDGVVGGGEQSGGGNPRRHGTEASARSYGGFAGGETGKEPFDTSGTYSRFFLVPKAPSRERTLTDGRRSPHPTQKPEALIRHLVTMVTPPGGIVLDPFLGSGTLGVVCEALGVRWMGIEREDEYADWAEDRIADRKAKWEVTA